MPLCMFSEAIGTAPWQGALITKQSTDLSCIYKCSHPTVMITYNNFEFENTCIDNNDTEAMQYKNGDQLLYCCSATDTVTTKTQARSTRKIPALLFVSICDSSAITSINRENHLQEAPSYQLRDHIHPPPLLPALQVPLHFPPQKVGAESVSSDYAL